jgi:hypothetical protein
MNRAGLPAPLSLQPTKIQNCAMTVVNESGIEALLAVNDRVAKFDKLGCKLGGVV